MQDSFQYSRKIPTQEEKVMTQKNMILIKIGEMLLNQGMLTLEEKKDFDRMVHEQL